MYKQYMSWPDLLNDKSTENAQFTCAANKKGQNFSLAILISQLLNRLSINKSSNSRYRCKVLGCSVNDNILDALTPRSDRGLAPYIIQRDNSGSTA